MGMIIRGGRMIDPANGVDKVQDIFIEGGNVVALEEKPEKFKIKQIIDAKNQIVCPGLVDLRARMREPGHQHKGSITSESIAAANAGITTLSCPPDTDPVIDTPAVIELIHRRASEERRLSIVPLGALTQGLEGHQISEMHALQQVGCNGMSNAHAPVSTEVMRRAFLYRAFTARAMLGRGRALIRLDG